MMDVFILGAVRTAIGGFGGGLSGFTPAQLGAAVAKEAIRRAEVSPDEISHVVIGNVIPTGPEDAYLSRAIGLAAGIPKEVPALNVSRLCGSGAQAVVSAAQGIALGDGEIALAGGAECMSRAPHYLTTGRFGQKMGDAGLIDGLTGVLTDPFGSGIMGVTAENIAERWGFTREVQDAFALESQRRLLRPSRMAISATRSCRLRRKSGARPCWSSRMSTRSRPPQRSSSPSCRPFSRKVAP